MREKGMEWAPNEASLAQVVELLKESHSPDTDTQRVVEQVCLPLYVAPLTSLCLILCSVSAL